MTTPRQPPLVLVADDDEDLVTLLAFRLDLAGYRTTCALDGQSALELAVAHTPAIGVLDVRMPKLDGYALTEAIRGDSLVGEMPIILLTANVRETDVSRGFDAGADDYVKKPFSPEELLARVQAILGRRTFGR